METYSEKFDMGHDEYLYLHGTKTDSLVSFTLFMNDIRVTMSVESGILKNKDLKEMVSSSCQRMQKMNNDMDGKVMDVFKKYQKQILAIRRKDLEEDDMETARLHHISYHILSSALSQAVKDMDIFKEADKFYTYNSNRDLSLNKVSPLTHAGEIAREILKGR